MFEPEIFRKEIYCIEESTCEIVRTFERRSRYLAPTAVIRRPGNYAPLQIRRYAPEHNCQVLARLRNQGRRRVY